MFNQRELGFVSVVLLNLYYVHLTIIDPSNEKPHSVFYWKIHFGPRPRHISIGA